MTFPSSIFSQRELENLPGLVYDSNNKKTLFAEDMLNHGNEIHAIEATLGEGVAGTYDTVAERLDNMSGGGGGSTLRRAIYTHTTNMITAGGFEQIEGIETVEVDTTGGLFDAAFASLTADKDGAWRFGYELEMSTGPRYIVTIFKNGVEYHRMVDTLGAGIMPPPGSTLCEVVSGDVLQFYIYCSASGQYCTGGRLEMQEVA